MGSTTSHGRLSLLYALATLFPSASASWGNPLEKLLPDSNAGFQHILHNSCSAEYAALIGNGDDVAITDSLLYKFDANSGINAVVNCMLEATPELVKFKMASVQVLLGLTPAILATLGATPQETGMLAVIARRPLLALLLSFASPAVFPLRSSEYTRGIKELNRCHMNRPDCLARADPAIVLLEYLLTVASIANIGELGYRLGAQVVLSLRATAPYFFVLWPFLGAIIHMLGATALRMRTKVVAQTRESEEQTQHQRKNSSAIESLRSSIQQPGVRNARVNVTILPESLGFFFMSWFTAVGTAVHIIFGTTIFSSMLFVSIDDGCIIIVRLMASVVVCRVILTYELAILRGKVEVTEINE